jgi:hypothetical protein
MKKFNVILLLCFYILPAIGLNVFVHYCGGKISSISIAIAHHDSCGCESKKMKKDCCKDETFSFEFDDDQIQLKQDFNTIAKFTYSPTLLSQPLLLPNCSYKSLTVLDCSFHPPNKGSTSLYILNRVIRI